MKQKFAAVQRRMSVEPLFASLYKGAYINPSVYSLRSQTAPDGRESPLSLRDISPHRGESPYLREPKSPLFLPENHRKNVQNRVQYLSKSSKLENVNNLFIILQQHCQFCLPLLPKNNNSICSIQKINKFV